MSKVFGRRMAFATAEYQRVIYDRRIVTAALAGFVDVARAWAGREAEESMATQTDIGAGLRLNLPRGDGQFRLDFGYGLQSKSAAWSAGYAVPFGR